jgi:hypothetical protein
MYINDLADYPHHCKIYLYVDDCALFLPVNKNQDVGISQNLQSDLNSLSGWSNTWKLKFKGNKSKEVLFQSQKNLAIPYPILSLNNEHIPKGNSHKHLGVILDSALTEF